MALAALDSRRAINLARWLTRVCVNHCTSMRRRLHARGGPPLALFDAGRTSVGRDQPAETRDATARTAACRSGERAAITLNYRYGYSVNEFAGFMG